MSHSAIIVMIGIGIDLAAFRTARIFAPRISPLAGRWLASGVVVFIVVGCPAMACTFTTVVLPSADAPLVLLVLFVVGLLGLFSWGFLSKSSKIRRFDASHH
jgi:hypothetical protein